MSGKVIGVSGRVAVFPLVTALMLCVFFVASAFAYSPHISATGVTSSCASCHSAHSSDASLLLRTAGGGPSRTASCLNCHNGTNADASNIANGPVDSFGLSSGHTIDVGTTSAAGIGGCDTCHNIHGASSDARRIPARKINGVAVTSAGKQLCLACHDAGDSWYGAGYPSTASPTRDATGYPVSGTWPGPSTYASETNAHRLIPETTQTISPGDPVAREQGDCRYCHAAHGGKNAYDGLLTTFTVPSQSTLASDQADGSYAALCFTCHGGPTPNGFSTAPVDIKQFATAAGGSSGHSIVTSGGTLPVGAPLPCFECHNPHGSKRGNGSLLSDERGASLATTSAAGVRAFCFTCHTASDTTAGWDSTAQAYAPVPSAEKIVGLPRDGGVLHLPAIDGHAESDTVSCYECHGNSYDSGGRNVHDPGQGSSTASATGPLLALAPNAVVTGAVPATISVDASASSQPSASVAATGSLATTDSLAAIITLMPTDTTPPLTVSDAVATYTLAATITLSAVDDTGGTGVAETYSALDGGDVTTGTVVSTSTAGSHTLTFWSVDSAGNVEPPTTVTFFIVDQQVVSMTSVFGVRQDYWTGAYGT